jgi:hypothetical protein
MLHVGAVTRGGGHVIFLRLVQGRLHGRSEPTS